MYPDTSRQNNYHTVEKIAPRTTPAQTGGKGAKAKKGEKRKIEVATDKGKRLNAPDEAVAALAALKESLPSIDFTGWTARAAVRSSGHVDKEYFSPGGKKFRSTKEVRSRRRSSPRRARARAIPRRRRSPSGSSGLPDPRSFVLCVCMGGAQLVPEGTSRESICPPQPAATRR